MGFRVNKRIKICKGVHVNIGKKGLSTSVKVGNTTINSRGRVSTRIAPGISYTTNLNSSNNNKANNINYAVVNKNNKYINKTPIEKDKVISIILCCIGFIGIGGIHKFYEQKYLLGVVYLFTGGLFLIGTIIDLITLLSNPRKYIV